MAVLKKHVSFWRRSRVMSRAVTLVCSNWRWRTLLEMYNFIESFLLKVSFCLKNMHIMSGNFWWSFCQKVYLIKQIWTLIFFCIKKSKQNYSFWFSYFTFHLFFVFVFGMIGEKWNEGKRTMLNTLEFITWSKGLKKKESGRNLEIWSWAGLVLLQRLYQTPLR